MLVASELTTWSRHGWTCGAPRKAGSTPARLSDARGGGGGGGGASVWKATEDRSCHGTEWSENILYYFILSGGRPIIEAAAT